jgi:hypothetical protein
VRLRRTIFGTVAVGSRARFLIRFHMVRVPWPRTGSLTPVLDSRHDRFRSQSDGGGRRRWSASPRLEWWVVESLIVGVGLA